MKSAYTSFYDRTSILGYMEYRFRDAARPLTEVVLPEGIDSSEDFMHIIDQSIAGVSFSVASLDRCGGCNATLAPGNAFHFESLKSYWEREFDIACQAFHPWRVWTYLGGLLVRLKWPCDLVPITRRPRRSDKAKFLLGKPSWKKGRALLGVACTPGGDRVGEVADPATNPSAVLGHDYERKPVSWGSHSHFVRYHPCHVLRAIRVGLRLRHQSDLGVTVLDSLAYAFPERGQEISAELDNVGHRDPGPNTMLKAYQTLACVGMHANRILAEPFHSVWHYPNFDASPQGGTEILGMNERIVKRRALQSVPFREFPLQSLPHGCTGITDNTLAVIHMVFLDYGPTKGLIDGWFNAVPSVLTDNGWVAEVVDSPRLTDAYLLGQRT